MMVLAYGFEQLACFPYSVLHPARTKLGIPKLSAQQLDAGARFPSPTREPLRQDCGCFACRRDRFALGQ